jgi:hypothetical protein
MGGGAYRLHSFGSQLHNYFVFLPASRPVSEVFYPTFWNICCFAISLDRPAVRASIWEWTYVKYISDNYCPTCMMVLSKAPSSFIAMAPTARKLWEEMRSKVYPCVRRQSNVAPHCTNVPMSRSKTSGGRLPVGGNTELIRHLGDFACWMFAIRREGAATGQIGPPKAS